MAQLTVYLPDEIERLLRQRARRSKKSVSSIIVELASRELRPRAWPDGFARLYGSCRGTLPEIEDLPPEPLESP